MQYQYPLKEAILLRRYKRFLADIELPSGEVLTIHCPNTGSMKNCQQAGARVWYSTSSNPKRKYPHTWEIIEIDKLHKVGINTGIANKLVREAIEANVVGQLDGYDTLRTEVAYGEEKSRIDFLLQDDQRSDCYVEVKNVSLAVGEGLGLFPDAVTTRGQKHLRELLEMRRQGCRAVLFFCVQHSAIDRVSPADEIDPTYGVLLREASAGGVELLAYRAEFNPQGSSIKLAEELPVIL